ncbi:hypothetical protein N7603_04255 [Acholeplasma vituli]|uniref:Smr domain-containing protein n=1 Tax=Paracholeplasma vituli TaxID=69473 RepID=A0ABT2PV82_9MOLU|nr:hypothetical protein [Paracholeplasma vituli]MCU0104864.1 hypothetical protein [Paracholeplasma vituli]
MITIDIKSDKPLVSVASARLLNGIRIHKNEKVIKIIHGYGSTGVGGKIKQMVHTTLETLKAQHQIQDYIPGEALVSFMGYADLIQKYKPLIQTDSDYRKGNDGITYIFIKP